MPIEEDSSEPTPDSAVARSLEESRKREYDNFRNYGETVIYAYDSAVRPTLSDRELTDAESKLAARLAARFGSGSADNGETP